MNDSTPYKLHRLIFTLDRLTDELTRAKFGISYKRTLFLVVLKNEDPMTQHQLALSLGYSDPAVSSMLVELAKEGFVTTDTSPDHKRKRIVTITKKGKDLGIAVERYLNEGFSRLLASASVDEQSYGEQTERIYQNLMKGKN